MTFINSESFQQGSFKGYDSLKDAMIIAKSRLDDNRINKPNTAIILKIVDT